MHAALLQRAYKRSLVLLLLGQYVVDAGNQTASKAGESRHVVNSKDDFQIGLLEKGILRMGQSDDGRDERDLLSRRLQEIITNDLNDSSTAMTIITPDGPLLCPGPMCVLLGLYAGLPISSESNLNGGGLDLFVTPNKFGALQDPRLRVVNTLVTEDMAMNSGGCRSADYWAREGTVSGEWGTMGVSSTVPLEIDNTFSAQLISQEPLVFFQGGKFKICYSDTGTFGNSHADIVPFEMQIYGIYDDRTVCARDPTCLQDRVYRCYLLRQAHNNYLDSRTAPTSCIVDYKTDGKGFLGAVAQYGGSWSGAWGPMNYDSDGVITNAVTRKACTTQPEDILCKNGATCNDGYHVFDPNASDVTYKGTLDMPTAYNTLQGLAFNAYTVGACYCPDYKCGELAEFPANHLQQVGILHYYVSKVCIPGATAQGSCLSDFTGTTPQHRFAVRVECPTDACSTGLNNRMKLLTRSANNDLPSWYRNSNGGAGTGCGMSGYDMHGKNPAGRLLLPPNLPNIDIQYTSGDRPGSVYGNQEFKVWNYRDQNFNRDEAGFMFKMGTTDYELRNFDVSVDFDVCYCDDNCNSDINWFKVGQLRFSAFRLVSSAQNTSETSDQFTLEYVNQPGVIAFSRPWKDYGLYGLNEGGMIKLVQDNSVSLTDAGCAVGIWDRYLIDRDGFMGHQETTASTLFYGAKPSNVSDRLVFNAGNLDNKIRPLRAGVMAICYCSQVSNGQCYYDQWILAARLTIRGPGPGQFWRFSTHVVFRFAVTGYGLTGMDKVRIIPETGSCDDDAHMGNPSAAYSETNIKVQCPHPCSEVGKVTDVLNGDLSVAVVDDAHYMCNTQNEMCRGNDVKSVTVLNDTHTEVDFESAPFLSTGDMITLIANVECHEDDLDINGGNCNQLKESVVQGQTYFADTDSHEYTPRKTLVGHTVTTTSDTKKVLIPVGWPEAERPKLKVYSRLGKKGKWVRHSKAITKEEIMATRQRQGMKVCWKYPGQLGKYVTQAGTMDLIDANAMSYALISLVTSMTGQTAPLIISFKTASAQTGKKYNTVEGPTQLKVYFTKNSALDVHFANGAAIQPNEGEDEVVDSRQYICGKLFMELWSDDDVLGFPMPSGCYYRQYGNTKELNMVFSPKNGLSPGKVYMFVVKGTALGEAALVEQLAKQYVNIFTMDDVNTKPYEAIERGVATLDVLPMDPAYGSEGVRFMHDDGFKLVGGQGASMNRLQSGSYLNMEMRGDPDMGGIKANSILRVFMRPLLMWQLDKSCNAYCTPYDQVTAPCGIVESCRGASTVPNYHMNYLKIVMPATMATMTEWITHSIHVTDMKLPEQGFFMARLAAQITKPDDTKPDYIDSTSDYLWKSPDEGISVGKVVNVFGDGNQNPFKTQKKNIIYASITLAATLFSSVADGDAYLELILPEGYECHQPPGDIDGVSPWRTPSTLNVFGDQSPQGTGSPDEGSGSRGWSTAGRVCKYSMRQNGVLYAGSSLFIRVTANNPDFALKRFDITNRWSLNLTSNGYSTMGQTFGPLNFKTSGLDGAYADNVAVGGLLEKAVIVPLNFATSTSEFIIARGRIQIIFQTEQATGSPGSVQIIGPYTFTFDNPCKIYPLSRDYYGNRPELSTLRLPCIECACSSTRTPENRMTIQLTGSLLAKTYYGFETELTNPFILSAAGEWSIYTLSQYGYRVDGTAVGVPLLRMNSSLAAESGLEGMSFPLCQTQLNDPNLVAPRASIALGSMTPFNLSHMRTTVDVFPLQVPKNVNGDVKLTIVAPEGYWWDFTDAEFLYKRYIPGAPVSDPAVFRPSGAPNDELTADIPVKNSVCLACPESNINPIPQRDGNVMIWPAGKWDWTKMYGFQAHIITPPVTPSSAANAFFVQFSYDDANNTCLAASMVPVTSIKSLVNPHVDYVTNVESKDNEITFQLETISPIPPLGQIVIDGPFGFKFETMCTLMPAMDSRAAPYTVFAAAPFEMQLPDFLGCVADNNVDSAMEHVKITLSTNSTYTLEPGRYRWKLAVKNPTMPKPNPADEGKPCGTRHCWDFHTFMKTDIRCASLDCYGGCLVDGNCFRESFTTGYKYSENLCHTGVNPTQTGMKIGYWCPERCEGKDMCEVDMTVTTQSFPVNRKMVEAQMPVLTDSQRATSLRDDRPVHKNPMVFALKLERYMLEPAYLSIRGPLGFIFKEDCLADVDTRGDEVFGPSTELPWLFTPWVQEVIVMNCRGEGPNARILLDPGVSYGLEPERLYPFRIAVEENPVYQPEPNFWSLDYAGESSDPFVGFQLWTFTRTSVLTVSHAMTRTETNAVLPQNPITITFRPKNTVRGSGFKIQITAPAGFVVATSGLCGTSPTCGYCEMIVQPVTDDYISALGADPATSPEPNWLAPPSMLWGLADVDCRVKDLDDNANYLEAEVLSDIRELSANRDYQITIFVHNPPFDLPEASNLFKIETADSSLAEGRCVDIMASGFECSEDIQNLPTYRDEILLKGFALNERARNWVYLNEDIYTKEIYDRGMSAVPNLYFEFMFSRNLLPGDEIQMKAPRGFYYPPSLPEDGPLNRMCGGGFRWEIPSPPAPQSQPLPASNITCAGDTIYIRILEAVKIPQMTLFMFRVDTMNPPQTPHVMENNWQIYHYTTDQLLVQVALQDRPLLYPPAASEMIRSWDIKPQLKYTRIMLVGEQKAAGMYSTLAISFVPVSDADELEITARIPIGFDFTGCGATSPSHEVIATNVESLRIRAPMYADIQADVRIAGFRLGYIGGATEFDLITKLSSGIKMDESLRFQSGFRLPGHLDVRAQTIDSMYALQPQDYAVESLWGPRMGEYAEVEFHFAMTMEVDIGMMIRLRCLQYTLKRDVFVVRKGGDQTIVTAEVISDYGGELVARMGAKMWAGYVYEIRMSVITAMVPTPAEAMWSIEVLDGGPLPVDTNDMLTEGFLLVDKINFAVQAARAPPIAEVSAEVSIDPKGMAPTEAIVVAPPGFNFTEDCLESPGDNNELVSCEYLPGLIAGRSSAKLTFQESGLLQPTSYVMIKIVTPADNQDQRTWYVELKNKNTGAQLGWGADPVGIEIRQMAGADIIYSGVPGIEGWMAVQFITNEKIEAGGKIKVMYPKSITISCAGDYFNQVSIEGEVSCETNPRQGYFEVTMGRPMPPGSQAFAVTSTAPPAVNDGNFFSIMVYAPDGRVVDAAMVVPGLRIQHGLSVATIPLEWTASEPNRPGRVTVGFELLEDLPENDPPTMTEVVVTVPKDFTQQVFAPRHIEVVGNAPLPRVEEGTWVDNTNPRKLTIFFDPDQTATLAPAQYKFSFPITIPARLPAYNVYIMTICGPSTSNETCYGPDAERALLSLVWPGFNLGDVHPSALAYTSATGDARRSCYAGPTSAFVAILSAVLVLSFAKDHL